MSGRGAGVAALALLVPLLAGCDGGFPEGSLKAARLTRGDCFWACPAYSVEIRGDGRVIYQGRKNVVVVGPREGRAAPDDVARVLAAARAADFYGLRRVYLGRVSDNPLNTVRVRVGWRSHTVTEYAGEHACMPASVGALEAAIDQAAGVRRWVAGDASTLPALRAKGYDFGSADAARMLKQALTYGGPDDLILALIAGGANVDAKDDDGLGLAHLVTLDRWPRVRAWLVAHGKPVEPEEAGSVQEKARALSPNC